MKIDFEHRQSAHCETGVISNLMRHHGLDISEPLALGIGSGLFFAHMPFIKVNGLPVTTYRIMPGDIFKKFSKRTGVEKVRTPSKTVKRLAGGDGRTTTDAREDRGATTRETNTF